VLLRSEGQRGKIAELVAPGEIERLERGEAGQRGQIAAELPAPGEVEELE
jgi:hypothetical protein